MSVNSMGGVRLGRLGLSLAILPALPLVPAEARTQARPAAVSPAVAPLSFRHFDHLFTEATVGGERVGVLHIYSVAPDYRYAIEPREGYACVDDAARGLVLLAAQPTRTPVQARQLDLLTRFVLRMQADNGYFHNFIWAGGRINREYRTSLAELNWWSLRALWGLEAALPRLSDPALRARARRAADRLVANLVRDLPASTKTEVVEGVVVPAWLPFGSGADAGATAVLGLLAHLRRTNDPAARALVGRLGDGLVRMQATGAHAAHLSWRNQWHAWGNLQSYALLRAGAALGRSDFADSAMAEVRELYPHLLAHGMLSSFALQDGRIADAQRFPQIAYGLAPMILAATEAHRRTGDPRDRDLALRLAGWFGTANDAGRRIYDPATGRVLDGINGPGRASADSGAESTVEGLLALTALGGTPLP